MWSPDRLGCSSFSIFSFRPSALTVRVSAVFRPVETDAIAVGTHSNAGYQQAVCRPVSHKQCHAPSIHFHFAVRSEQRSDCDGGAPSMCVPPSMVLMLLTKLTIVSVKESEHHCSATSTCTPST